MKLNDNGYKVLNHATKRLLAAGIIDGDSTDEKILTECVNLLTKDESFAEAMKNSELEGNFLNLYDRLVAKGSAKRNLTSNNLRCLREDKTSALSKAKPICKRTVIVQQTTDETNYKYTLALFDKLFELNPKLRKIDNDVRLALWNSIVNNQAPTNGQAETGVNLVKS